MNAMTPFGSREDHEAAGDLVLSRAELARLDAQRQRERARQERRRWWVATGLGAVIMAQAAVNLGLLGFIWVRPPQSVPTPIVVYQRDDGTVTNYASWESLPDRVRTDTVVNIVWSYVQQRESWSAGNAPYAYQMVSALSSPRIRDAFQAEYKDEKTGPAVRYKDGTTVGIEYRNWEARCSTSSCPDGPDSYLIRFRRIETPPGGLPVDRGPYWAAVKIRRNVPIPTDRIWQRWTFNAAQIQVTDYAAEREGVTR